jgi:acetyl coenzyme A synthetase (ADP forming)-like protein
MDSLEPIFRPASIAVVGASRSPGGIGYEIVHNLVEHGYRGALYPVNPNARFVHSIPAYRSVLEIPGALDLAVIAVPKACVLEVVDECGQKGVPALVVISAGFKEVGGAGVELERALLERVKRFGMRLVGPNCIGVLNTEPDVSMNATFAPTTPPAGPVSFVSQSGAMGVTILDYAATYGIGIHHFVSMGNRADVSSNDLLEYWGAEEATKVILMYLESFGNPRNFTRLARTVTRNKPVLVVKAGRSRAGARAALSHTGALAGLDVATDALLAQCGVIRVETVEELFDLAMAFSRLPVPRGERVAIVTNAGGPGIIIADACEAAGLAVAELAPATRAALARSLPEEAGVANPVDMIASATAASYRTALELVLADPNVDAVIASFVPVLGIRQLDVAGAIVEVRRAHPEKPLLAVLLGQEGLPQGRAELGEAGVPAYIFPESAARALAAMVRHRRWLERPAGTVRRFEVDRTRARGIIEGAARAGAEWLPQADALALLECYGIPTVERRLARSAEEAVEAARAIGSPVVLKVLSPDIVHKTEVGGILLDLQGEEEVRRGYARVLDRVRAAAPGARLDGVLVERQLGGGKELVVGMTLDPSFGAVLMFGLGGIYVEALHDVAFRVEPVTDVDAREMIRSIRGFRLLEGVRGEEAVDLEAVAEVIEHVSQLVGEHHEVLELDVNPLVADARGVVAVDARVRVATPR